MKVFKYILFLFITIFSFACKPEPIRSEKPENLIERKKMVELLYHIQLIEGRYQRRFSNPGQNVRELTIVRYAKLFEKENVTEKQFMDSYHYYNETPFEMEKVWDEVLNRIAVEQEVMERESDEKFTDD